MGQNSLLVHQRVTPSWGNAPLCLLPRHSNVSNGRGKTRRENLSCTDPIGVEKSSDFGTGMGATRHPPAPLTLSSLCGSTPLVTVDLFSSRPRASCLAVGNSPS